MTVYVFINKIAYNYFESFAKVIMSPFYIFSPYKKMGETWTCLLL